MACIVFRLESGWFNSLNRLRIICSPAVVTGGKLSFLIPQPQHHTQYKVMVTLKLEPINNQQITEVCKEVVRMSKEYKQRTQFVGLTIYGNIEWFYNASAMMDWAMPLVKYTTTKKLGIQPVYSTIVLMDSTLLSKFAKGLDKALADYEKTNSST